MWGMTASPHIHQAARRRRRPQSRNEVGIAPRLKRAWQLILATSRALWSAPPTIRIPALTALLLLLCLGLNWAYHALRKPTEIFFPLESTLDKSPYDTWRHYGSLFLNVKGREPHGSVDPKDYERTRASREAA